MSLQPFAFAFAAALAAAAALVAGCAASRAPDGNRVALVIGNSAYENAPPLANPANDAADMCRSLRKLRFRTLCHTNLRSRAEFEARVQEYVGLLGPRTVGVFYYSGHGVQVGNANYLIPTQTQPQAAAGDPARLLYSVDTLLFDALGRAHPQLQLVILDACRTDLFGAAPRGAVPAPLVRALAQVTPNGHSLQPIKDAPPGTKVFYATASRDAAFDGDGRNGPLTKHILMHIETPGLELESFFKDVTKGVEEDTLKNYRKRQTPYTYGSYGGRFCFAGCSGQTVGPITPLP